MMCRWQRIYKVITIPNRITNRKSDTPSLTECAAELMTVSRAALLNPDSPATTIMAGTEVVACVLKNCQSFISCFYVDKDRSCPSQPE